MCSSRTPGICSLCPLPRCPSSRPPVGSPGKTNVVLPPPGEEPTGMGVPQFPPQRPQPCAGLRAGKHQDIDILCAETILWRL